MDESGDINFIEVPAADVNSMSLATEQDTDGDGVGDTNDVFPVSNLDATFNGWIGAAAENPEQFTKSAKSAKSGKRANEMCQTI